ncbi:hypothetical protein AVEN_157871-1 [Araneus ventricosus]|uniref:Uncharacterized protein n=1 Tax=Araneus ventricosus TaxID=182803 RepID=A0A4Y2E9D3_ARAVE|nr:hypothetical protein AVEN_157871-1 [Araneus ventricosus]
MWDVWITMQWISSLRNPPRKGSQHNILISSTRSYFKKKLHAISTQLWQNEWDNDDTGMNVHLILPKVKSSPASWQRPEIIFATGHGLFPTYLKRFSLKTTDCCGCASSEALCTSQPAAPL